MSGDASLAAGRRAVDRLARRSVAIVAVSAVLTLLVLAHVHLLERWVLAPGVPDPLKSVLLWGVAALGFGMLAQPALERSLPLRWARPLSWPPLLWMGVFFVGLNATLLVDGVGWLIGAAWPEPGGDPLAAARLRAGAAVALTLAAVCAGLPGALRVPRVRRVELGLARWPAALDGFRIVQISDLHVGPILGRRFVRALVARVNALAPDLLVVTGDLVDGREDQLRAEVEPFADLAARNGVFFVTGNHDFYSGADAWTARVEALGMRPLRNERVTIGAGDAAFELAGVDDYRGDWRRGSTHDMERALRGREEGRAVVLLAHDPSSFPEAAARGVDLQLSGHTHGGQIFPFQFLVRLAVPFVAGLYRRGASTLYVSRGTGFWGPPLRLLAPAEITELVLSRAPEASA